jgi:peroxiredoxin family protein
VLLARPALLDDPREALLAARGVATLAVLLEAAAELPIRRIACEAGLRAEALDPAALAPGVAVAGVVTFLNAVGEGQIVSL